MAVTLGTVKPRRRKGPLVCYSLLWLLFTQPLFAADAESEVKNLAYGEVLYQFYQQRYFDAIVHLTASLQKSPMPEQGGEAELLLGGLYLSYGMHNEAERLLKALLAEEDNEALHDQVLFYLTKSRYQRGLQQTAEETLKQIKGLLPPMQQQELSLIYGQLLLDQARNREAATQLSTLQGDSDWALYGRYNLAIARLRMGEADSGHALLDSLGRLETNNEELTSLRDRANLTLGSWLRQQGNPIEAKRYFDRIRVNGLLSNDALLVAGWGYAEQENYAEALVHWFELSERQESGSEVQQALLAIPYAFLQLNAKPQAVEHYNHAVGVYQREMAAVTKAQAVVRSGAFIRSHWEQADPLSADRLTPYLQSLLVSHQFQTAMQSLNDLLAIRENLTLWSSDLTTFDTMLMARRENFSQKLPLLDRSLAFEQFQQLKQQQQQQRSTMAQIKADSDAPALATAAEKRLLIRLDTVDRQLQKVGQRVDQEKQQRSALLRGILLWQASSDYKPRLWSAEKELLEIDQLLEQIKRQREEVEAARQQLPARFTRFGEQIATTAEQIKSLQSVVDQLIDGQSRDVTRMTLTHLDGQQQRLDSYLTQAQFAIAQIHDSALKQSEERIE